MHGVYHNKIDHVRFGSFSDIGTHRRDVRFTPESGHQLSALRCPLSANQGHAKKTNPKSGMHLGFDL